MFIRMKERSDTTCRAFKGDEEEWEEEEEEDEEDDMARGEAALEKEEDAEEADPNKK
jgi:hypothetical protein